MRKLGIGVVFSLLLPLFPLSAQEVDILWQGETYIPPFYEGRSLWSKQSMVSMIAVPQGLGNPNSLIYKWTQNGTVLGNVSGIGASSLKFEDSLFSKPQVITVEILTPNEEVLAEASVVLEPVSPILLVFENNPIYGYSFHKEIGGDFKITEGEVTFGAFPLFSYPAFRETDSISYRWSINNEGLTTGPNATYRVPDNTEGSSIVSVSMKDSVKILPALSKNILIQFGHE